MSIIKIAIKGRMVNISRFEFTKISSITLLINSGRAGVVNATMALQKRAIRSNLRDPEA